MKWWASSSIFEPTAQQTHDVTGDLRSTGKNTPHALTHPAHLVSTGCLSGIGMSFLGLIELKLVAQSV